MLNRTVRNKIHEPEVAVHFPVLHNTGYSKAKRIIIDDFPAHDLIQGQLAKIFSGFVFTDYHPERFAKCCRFIPFQPFIFENVKILWFGKDDRLSISPFIRREESPEDLVSFRYSYLHANDMKHGYRFQSGYGRPNHFCCRIRNCRYRANMCSRILYFRNDPENPVFIRMKIIKTELKPGHYEN